MELGSGYNLPPGCYEHHLPGNRPEDAAFDHYWDNKEKRIIEVMEEALKRKLTDEERIEPYNVYTSNERVRKAVDEDFDGLMHDGT